jgi:hypothetical protein
MPLAKVMSFETISEYINKIIKAEIKLLNDLTYRNSLTIQGPISKELKTLEKMEVIFM